MSRRSPLQPPARFIFVTGFMATGKTTNGRCLAQRLGLGFVDTDEQVEAHTGKRVAQIFAEDGEERFRELEHQALRAAIAGPAAVVSTGGGMIAHERNLVAMRAAGPVLALSASAETILRRAGNRPDRPLLVAEDRLGRIRELLAQRAAAYARADHQVSSEGTCSRETVEAMVAALARDPRTATLVRERVRVGVRAGDANYLIHIGEGAYDDLGSIVPAPSQGVRCAVVTTDVVGPLYAAEVAEALRCGGWEPQVIAVPDGEASKTLEMAGVLYGELAESGVDGGGALFALGGGVAGDLGGFVAATYRRGIRFVQLPTSLLAQVDASVGGKVAVDHPRAKNLIGAFHQPHAVIIDTRVLRSLSIRLMACGLAELIKHALIADETMLEFMECELPQFLALEKATVRYLLARSCQIKADVVEADPRDQGQRAVLNFGHTVGHAVEVAADGWALGHGEAVAIGMVAEARMGEALGLTQAGTSERLARLLERAGLPTSACGIDLERAERALLQDKKIAAGRLRLPYVPRAGMVAITEEVGAEALVGALRDVHRSGPRPGEGYQPCER